MKLPKNKYLLSKALVNFAIIILGTILVSVILSSVQSATIRNKVQTESEQILNQISETIDKNRRDVDKLTTIYHNLNQSTAKDLKEVLESGLFDALYSMDDNDKTEIINDIVDRADVPYLFVMNHSGEVMAAPYQQWIGKNLVQDGLLTPQNLAELVDDDFSDLVKEVNQTGSYYFYSESIKTDKGSYYVVFGTNASILETQFASMNDISRMVKNIVVGEGGFVFAIDKEKGEFIYYKDAYSELTGENIFSYGLTENVLRDGNAGKESINGLNYFCVSKDCGKFTIAVAASEYSKMYAANSSWMWSIVGLVIVSILCLVYTIIVRNDYLFNEKEGKKVNLFKYKDKDIYVNVSIFKRIMPVVILGVLLMYGISFYSATMVDISKAIADSNVNINELENNFDDADITKEIASEYYENQYLAKARILAYLFEENPSVLNKNRNKQYFIYDENNVRIPAKDDEGNNLLAASNSKILAEYCDKNNIHAIYLYDEQGRLIATNLEQWYFQLSFNPEDQSYPFREVLDQKISYYIQPMGIDEGGNTSQYIGTSFNYYTTKDQKGETLYVSRYDYQQYQQGQWKGNPIEKHSSVLQIGLNTDVMESILSSTDYKYLIEKSAINDAYLILFDNSADHKVLYSPKEESIDKTAKEIGLNDNAFNGNYIGFQKANGIDYLIDIQYYEGYYIGTAILKDNLYVARTKVALITAAMGFILVFVMTGLVTMTTDEEEKQYLEYAEKVSALSDNFMFIISTPAGDRSVAEKAVSRWDNKNIPWNEKTPEQKLTTITFTIMAVIILGILLFATLVKKGNISDIPLAFIISGNWDRGFNFFALTACGLVLIATIVIANLLNIPIKLITSIFGTKSETVGHLLSSVIRYVAAIYSVFYCLYLLGFNSTSLLTSAGILSLVVALGSQSLIKDVVAGVFIIFEGSFRVGDIVMINGYRGQVLDVGLRTTKIMAADHNIKIINNNEVNGVINMTRVSSLCTIDVPIAYGVSMSETERILNSELPVLKEKIEGIIDGPYYKGVSKFDHKIITVQVSVLCKETDIENVKSGLYREVLDIIYRYGLHQGNK